jgi:hypothetical protein
MEKVADQLMGEDVLAGITLATRGHARRLAAERVTGGTITGAGDCRCGGREVGRTGIDARRANRSDLHGHRCEQGRHDCHRRFRR